VFGTSEPPDEISSDQERSAKKAKTTIAETRTKDKGKAKEPETASQWSQRGEYQKLTVSKEANEWLIDPQLLAQEVPTSSRDTGNVPAATEQQQTSDRLSMDCTKLDESRILK